MCGYNSGRLYEDAFNVSYNWKNGYHLMYINIISKCVKKSMHQWSFKWGYYYQLYLQIMALLQEATSWARPSCVNLFWFNLVASGVGKFQTRKHMISQPLQYILQNIDHAV